MKRQAAEERLAYLRYHLINMGQDFVKTAESEAQYPIDGIEATKKIGETLINCDKKLEKLIGQLPQGGTL